MDDLKIRCSSLGVVLGDSKCKEFDLSVGAKSHVEQIVKENLLKYHIDIESKYLTKGNLCENDSIDLYNEYFFTSHKKNTERKENEWISGECDVDTGDMILEFKTSYSKDTFPVIPKDAKSKKYECQTKGYMWLWERFEGRIVHCLVDTPDSMLDFENNLSIHHVSDLPIDLRLTINEVPPIEEDFKELVKHKVTQCRKYAKRYLSLIKKKNKSFLSESLNLI